jgi:glycosyltransferase involved in cell wall biosynthesis
MTKTIAFCTDGMHPFVLGGMQKHTLGLCRALALQGVKLILIHGTPEGENKPTEQEVTEVLFPDGRYPKYMPEIFTIEFPSPGKLPGHYLRRSKKFAKSVEAIVAKKKVDLIYAQGFTAWTILQQKQRKAPVWLNFHGLNMFQPAFGNRAKVESLMLRRFVRRQLLMADKVISLGGRLTDILKEQGVSENKIFVQSNGLDANWLQQEQEIFLGPKRKFLFVGRNDKVKGFDMLLPVVAEFDKHTAEFHFVGPFSPDDFPVHANVIVHGVIKEESVMRDLMDKMDIVLCTSYSEGMPTYILEAMSRSCAVLSTNVGAVAELVNTDNGVLIEDISMQGVRRGIRYMLDLSDGDLLRMKEASRNRAKTFGWDNIAQQMLKQLG